ncbi:hypothetical protein JTE90_027928 [Oedothorax gibbosus]|uniref:Uncharacterized protein n=1 Tax=Oedothorax gibbosus TaxID=931172 RepID=A0AAV6VES1_9ARAC|nr:hypothetical protein JTE90_027928 [Oedothorax gibbosus]
MKPVNREDMASTATETSQSEDEIVIDASTLNHLMYSIGRLKYSMRSLGNMNLVAAFPQEENENDSLTDCSHNLESSAILENAIAETLAERTNQANKIQNEKISSLEDLELINKKLNIELEKIRLKYKAAFKDKISKSIGTS